MSTQIFYFSGTGNSLFAAKELQKRLPDCTLVPMVALMSHKQIRTTADTVGFVFPVHAITIPIVVKKFIEKLDCSSADYLFAAATRMGTIFRGFEKIDRLLKKQGKRLSAHFLLNMANNDSRHGRYTVPSGADIEAMEKQVLCKLGAAQAIIQDKRISREEDTEFKVSFEHSPIVNAFLEKTVTGGMVVCEHTGGVQYFYADDKCTGCGVCERVCLSRKISMQGGKPIWKRNVLCYMCFACLNLCPREAVQIKDIPGVKSESQVNGRYPHPYATVKDIAAQREWAE